MSRKNINFEDRKIKKSDFYKNRKVTKIDVIDANKILVFKEEPCDTKNSFKYFIGYNDNNVIRPLCINLPQMTGYVRKFEGNTTTSFKISDKQLFKKYNEIWKRVEKLLKIELDSKPIYGDDDKYIKTKIKIFGGSVNANFQDKKMPKEKVPCNSLSIIILLLKQKKVLSSNTSGRVQIWTTATKKKDENLIDDLEKSFSDNVYNDEIESDNESNE